MDLTPFKRDIDELIDAFAEVELGLFLFPVPIFFVGYLQMVTWRLFLGFGPWCFLMHVDFGYWQGESTSLADMKRIWLSKKFSYIYEARPSTNLAFFMQSLYAHSIGRLLNVWLGLLVD